MNFNSKFNYVVVIFKILFLMCLMTFKAHATPCNFANAIKSPKLGDKIYLNACGGNPQVYFTSPFNLANIYELPNLVVAEKQSIYKRPFQTKASSVIKLNNIKLTAILENFRDLKIVNEKGGGLLQRKITGATSLFEIRSKDLPIAWGVGWNKYDKQTYNTDFTAFRIYFPLVQSNKIIFQERLLSLAQTSYEKDFINKDQFLLVDVSQIGAGAGGCYYCFPNFLILDPNKGLVAIADTNTLKKYINFKGTHNSFMILLWLINKKDMVGVRDYINYNLQEISDNINTQYKAYFDPHNIALPNKEECKTYLKNDHSYSACEVNKIFDHCFPFIFKDVTFNSWMQDVLPHDSSFKQAYPDLTTLISQCHR